MDSLFVLLVNVTYFVDQNTNNQLRPCDPMPLKFLL